MSQPFDRAIGFCFTCIVPAALNCDRRRHGAICLHLQTQAASHEHQTPASYGLRDRATVFLGSRAHCEFVPLKCLNLLRPDRGKWVELKEVF